MRKSLPDRLEDGRVRIGPFSSEETWGPYGKFVVQGPCGARLMIVASGADLPASEGWEHVSVSVPPGNRCPNWPEMCFVKDLFWDADETVLQFHPPKSEYVNNHPGCLHLWRHVDQKIQMPNSILVGLKDKGVMTNDERAETAMKMLGGGQA